MQNMHPLAMLRAPCVNLVTPSELVPVGTLEVPCRI